MPEMGVPYYEFWEQENCILITIENPKYSELIIKAGTLVSCEQDLWLRLWEFFGGEGVGWLATFLLSLLNPEPESLLAG